MNKPVFKFIRGRVVWTKPRVRYVKHLAEVHGMTARDIANDVGLPAGSHPRIYEVAKRFKIKMPGAGAVRTRRASILIGIDERSSATLRALALKMKLNQRETASQLLAAALGQGLTFCENILDEG